MELRTPRPSTEPRDGPTRNFHKNTEKIPRGPKFWTPRIYPQNTPKIPKNTPKIPKNAHFGYFFGIFGVCSWGSRISARGVCFRYFSWEILKKVTLHLTCRVPNCNCKRNANTGVSGFCFVPLSPYESIRACWALLCFTVRTWPMQTSVFLFIPLPLIRTFPMRTQIAALFGQKLSNIGCRQEEGGFARTASATFARSLINIGQAGFCELSWQLSA